MATILKCDTCDRVSPDKDGLHVANHWTEIKVGSRLRRGAEVEYLICTDCLRNGVRLSEKGVARG